MSNHEPPASPPASPAPSSKGGLLDLIEKVGNRLPDPATLFIIGTVLVMILSAIAVASHWEVEKELPVPQFETVRQDRQEVRRPVLDEDGEQVVEWRKTGEVLQPQSLLTREGIDWALRTMVTNFTGFAPLGIVLVGMLGIGVADRTGLLAALLKAFMLVVPGMLLTPTMVFVGIMSSMALDAGYVVLPPLAAALYKSVGRSPIAGIAAVFAGVAAGFNANLLITGLDPLLAGLSQTGAQVIDPDYTVAATCNWWFMIASTVLITLVGWGVSSFFVERRLKNKAPEDGGPLPASVCDLADQRLTVTETRGLTAAVGALAVTFGIILVLILIPGAPLYTYHVDGSPMPYEVWVAPDATAQPPADAVVQGDVTLVPSVGRRFDRWVESIVPLLFFLFLVPGATYGIVTRTIKNDKNLAQLFTESMAYMAPIIVLAFFAGQFIAHFQYSGLDRMLAMWGGQALGKSELSPIVLMLAFIGVTMVFNLFVGSMSAKYTMFAPIFIPMFMLVGISPELTQAAYRIGDSVTNTITPLNAYLIIILVFMQKFVPKSGMGTLIATMLPYSIAFLIAWSLLLVIWMWLGIPLGPGGPLEYAPAG